MLRKQHGQLHRGISLISIFLVQSEIFQNEPFSIISIETALHHTSSYSLG